MKTIFHQHKRALGVFAAVFLLASLGVSAHFSARAKSGAFTADVKKAAEPENREARNDSALREAFENARKNQETGLRVQTDLQNQLKPDDYAEAQKRRFANLSLF